MKQLTELVLMNETTHRACANVGPLHPHTLFFIQGKVACTQTKGRGRQQAGYHLITAVHLHVAGLLSDGDENVWQISEKIYYPSTGSCQLCFGEEYADEETEDDGDHSKHHQKYPYHQRVTVEQHLAILKNKNS